jgi:hypothetical protein
MPDREYLPIDCENLDVVARNRKLMERLRNAQLREREIINILWIEAREEWLVIYLA